MKRLGITQRVDISPHGERRDALDQRWHALASELGFLALPLPNLAQAPELETWALDAVVLSGGNDLASISNAPDMAPERDDFERALLDYAIGKTLPVLGVCRGAQHLNVYFGGRLAEVPDNANVHHALRVEAGYDLPDEVNSYHRWGIRAGGLAAALKPVAYDPAGNVEAFVHETYPLAGMMWHPERESPFQAKDLAFMRHVLCAR